MERAGLPNEEADRVWISFRTGLLRDMDATLEQSLVFDYSTIYIHGRLGGGARKTVKKGVKDNTTRMMETRRDPGEADATRGRKQVDGCTVPEHPEQSGQLPETVESGSRRQGGFGALV